MGMLPPHFCAQHLAEAFPGGQGYGGTREDWVDRAYSAEAQLETLREAVRTLLGADPGEEAGPAFYQAKLVVEALL